jgi:hypothetical protein
LGLRRQPGGQVRAEQRYAYLGRVIRDITRKIKDDGWLQHTVFGQSLALARQVREQTPRASAAPRSIRCMPQKSSASAPCFSTGHRVGRLDRYLVWTSPDLSELNADYSDHKSALQFPLPTDKALVNGSVKTNARGYDTFFNTRDPNLKPWWNRTQYLANSLECAPSSDLAASWGALVPTRGTVWLDRRRTGLPPASSQFEGHEDFRGGDVASSERALLLQRCGNRIALGLGAGFLSRQ